MITTPHILIFEPESNGHQMDFVRHLLIGIERRVTNARVTLLTTEEAAGHPNCQRVIDDFRQLVTLRVADPVVEGSFLFRALGTFYERQWRNAERLDRNLTGIGADNVDFVLIPHLETIGLLQLGLRRRLFHRIPWAVIALGIRFHHRKSGIVGPTRSIDVLYRVFFWWLLRDPALGCLGSIDPYLPSVTRNSKVVYCPDPSPVPQLSSVREARAAYGIRPETCVVLVFGFLDRRKCIDVLLEAVARAAPDVDLTVLLAGYQHPGHLGPVLNGEAARKLREAGRLVEVNRFIEIGPEIDPLSAADIVWVFYEPDFVFSSNVLIRAGLSRLPVVARRVGLIGHMVQEQRSGLSLSSDSPDAIAAALTQLARDPAQRREMGENGQRAFAGNTPEAFARPIIDCIDRILVSR